MFRRLWDRIANLWRATPCCECGAPSVGFAARVAGKLQTKDAAGKPATRYYLRASRPMCAKCLEAQRCRLA
jgi:hypothetical protein